MKKEKILLKLVVSISPDKPLSFMCLKKSILQTMFKIRINKHSLISMPMTKIILQPNVLLETAFSEKLDITEENLQHYKELAPFNIINYGELFNGVAADCERKNARLIYLKVQKEVQNIRNDWVSYDSTINFNRGLPSILSFVAKSDLKVNAKIDEVYTKVLQAPPYTAITLDTIKFHVNHSARQDLLSTKGIDDFIYIGSCESDCHVFFRNKIL